MIIDVMDVDFSKIDILRKYTYAQYTEKFRGIGTFTIHARLVQENLYLFEDRVFYVVFDNKIVGKVEHVKYSEDSDYEKVIEISGRLAIFILSKRVVKGTYKFFGKTYAYVYGLINKECNEDQAQTSRRLPFDMSYDNESYLESICSDIDKQVTGNYVWDGIESVLEQDGLGIYFYPQMTVSVGTVLDADKAINIRRWTLKISHGLDRTKGNTQGNEEVIFSKSLSNISRTEFERNIENYCNYGYVAGEGEGDERVWYYLKRKNAVEIAAINPERGYKCLEMFVDARDLQSEQDDGTVMNEQEYDLALNRRGISKFAEFNKSEEYSSTVITDNKRYVYGENYYLGDWCTVIDDELGIQVNAQITEVTRTVQEAQDIYDIKLQYGDIKRAEDISKKVSAMSESLQQTRNDTIYLENKLKRMESAGTQVMSLSENETSEQSEIRSLRTEVDSLKSTVAELKENIKILTEQ